MHADADRDAKGIAIALLHQSAGVLKITNMSMLKVKKIFSPTYLLSALMNGLC